jgi:hypothetical protein
MTPNRMEKRKPPGSGNEGGGRIKTRRVNAERITFKCRVDNKTENAYTIIHTSRAVYG